MRDEAPGDAAGIRAVDVAAFPTEVEADLVEALRHAARPLVSLVADDEGAIVGHALFSPVTLGERRDLAIMGLAPVAVAPRRQHRGIGDALVRTGLERCAAAGFGAVVVLGHPAYYPRFGFEAAARFGIRCEYDVPPEAFMVVELRPGYLRGASGTIEYHSAFAGL